MERIIVLLSQGCGEEELIRFRSQSGYRWVAIEKALSKR